MIERMCVSVVPESSGFSPSDQSSSCALRGSQGSRSGGRARACARYTGTVMEAHPAAQCVRETSNIRRGEERRGERRRGEEEREQMRGEEGRAEERREALHPWLRKNCTFFRLNVNLSGT
mgnify:CR=1 FL=1